MVRKVSNGVLAALVVASLLLVPQRAFADDSGTAAHDYSGQLDSIGYKLDNISSGIAGSGSSIDYGPRLDGMAQTLNNIYTVQLQQTQPEQTEEQKQEEVKQPEQKGPTELDYLKSIDEGISELTKEEPETEVETTALKAARSISLSAYTNVSPTGQWANYAKGYTTRLGWKDHYVFLQDSNSSYVMAWGDLRDTGTAITGNADWVRWYYAGNGSGYVRETGSGNIEVTYGQYTVMSDLAGWPMLAGADELLRREVMLYAIVAAGLFSLGSVGSFLLRNRNGTH